MANSISRPIVLTNLSDRIPVEVIKSGEGLSAKIFKPQEGFPCSRPGSVAPSEGETEIFCPKEGTAYGVAFRQDNGS